MTLRTDRPNKAVIVEKPSEREAVKPNLRLESKLDRLIFAAPAPANFGVE